MSDNPYAHSSSQPQLTTVPPNPVPTEMPRYDGRYRTIAGQIEAEEAFELAAECIPIDTGGRKRSTGSLKFSCIWFLFAVATFAVLIFFPGREPLAEPRTPDTISRCLFISGLVVMPTLIFSMLIYLRLRFKHGVRQADPPVHGKWELHLHAEGFQAVARTDDDRYVEMFLPWKHTVIQRSDRAWHLVNSGLIHVLIPYSWIGDVEQFRELDGFFHQLAHWRSQAGMKPAVPVENETAIFGELPAGIPFETNGWEESANLNRMLPVLRRQFPNYKKVYRWIIMPWLWLFVGVLQVALACSWAVYSLISGQSPGTLFLAFGLVMLFGFLAIYFGNMQRQYFSALTTGVLTGPEIWFNRGPVRFRMLVPDFKVRQKIEDSLVMSSGPSSKKVFVLSSSAFGGDAQFDEACRLAGVSTDS
ncbi:MAG: hypothetical protein AAF456_01945 [Planctomycetota bacterium]